ncbi:glycosyltransferase family 4 protein [Endozoicomonas ascidiicola]|uniref:glycosyltransferase family 4 protein n=1 Tax=Endozoicomonas ascidiicola TaxID=1698521 RepID=UPI00082C3085|nr:glycosyltransferase family 1 protein [Endozoicomonas ascidiicola]
MRPIRLAVFFDQTIQAGGGYQQALNAALLTLEIPGELVDVVFFTNLKENITTLSSHGVNVKLIHLSPFEKIRTYLRGAVLTPALLKVIKRFERYTPFEKYFIEESIDLVYFLSPTSRARSLEEINYITTVWDLCHRDDPEFPEVRWDRQLEARDKNYQAILPRAIATFVDSELGRNNLVRRYGIDVERIHVVPFQGAVSIRAHSETETGSTINICEKYQLSVPYVFYPAQFWAHKNHVYLLEGLRVLEDLHGIKVGAVFSGGDQGNQQYVEKRTRELGLEDRIRFAGFVPNEEVPDLYRQSLALVMPTYFGPTNLPPLEAFALGVPVLYSDKAGLRDQVGNAGMLMDLTNPETMAGHIKALLEDYQLKDQMVKAGHTRLSNIDSEDRVGVLHDVLKEFRARRLCWS